MSLARYRRRRSQVPWFDLALFTFIFVMLFLIINLGTQRTSRWWSYGDVAALSLAFIDVSIRLGRNLLRGKRRSPKEQINRLAEIGELVAFGFAILAFAPLLGGWMTDTLRMVIEGAIALILAAAGAYCFGGRNRLIALLTARAARRRAARRHQRRHPGGAGAKVNTKP